MMNPVLMFLVSLTICISINLVVIPIRCETDVNECTLDGQCQNNGSCDNFNGTYTCTCGAGYTGQNCEISVSIELFCLPAFQ